MQGVSCSKCNSAMVGHSETGCLDSVSFYDPLLFKYVTDNLQYSKYMYCISLPGETLNVLFFLFTVVVFTSLLIKITIIVKL